MYKILNISYLSLFNTPLTTTLNASLPVPSQEGILYFKSSDFQYDLNILGDLI